MWPSLLHPTLASLIAGALLCLPTKPALAASHPAVKRHSVDSSTGPRSDSEAKILWKNSQDSYGSGKYKDAVYSLRRLVDRYPGYPDAASYRELRYELGHAYLETNQNEEAITQFHAYLEGAGDRKHPELAKLDLGEAYLRLKRFNEAYLASLELENHPSHDIQDRALFVRTRALIGQNQDTRAQAAADSARKLAQRLKSPELLGEANQLELRLKARECERHPADGKQEEPEVRAQIDFRGVCLSEALIGFREVLASRDPRSSDEALNVMKKAFADFHQACQNPPDPPALKPKDRSKEQLRRYRAELRDALQKICADHRKTATTLISGWKQEKPSPTAFALQRLKPLEESLR